MPFRNRRQANVGVLLDRRKSYVDIIERVLGSEGLPDIDLDRWKRAFVTGGATPAVSRDPSRRLPRRRS